jgi:hypothetical protein
MFKIIMISAVVILAVGWIAYGIYEMKMRAEEKKHPKQVSERLQQARSGVTDWARKMASFKKPPYKGDQNKKTKS